MSITNLSACTIAQRARLLEFLRDSQSRGITTIEAREALDIMMPGARIFDLRHKLGFNIKTVWSEDVNAQGHKHRIARYVLFPGKYQEGDV